ncbi:MAG: hypothetical protein ACRDCE_10555 [Cetobacterium sp.]|uniref:hypothetical protein n=1 Tax=Cetobacterium sp. TaxID=2071632 RepID=UPI003EE7FB5E
MKYNLKLRFNNNFKKIILFILFLIFTSISVAEIHIPTTIPSDESMAPPVPDGDFIVSSSERDKIGLEKVKSVVMKARTEIFVPLEIISDIDIKTLIIDNQEVIVPFEIEVNKEPDKKNFYKLNYSENEIDIDLDGQIDTFIYSSKYINSKIIKDNYVLFKGKNISKEGKHEKIIYITIETE